jgi:hypothetical protein
MKSIMTHQFSRVPEVKTQRSSFDRSHGYKTTFDAGKLIPIFLDEALPGDTFNLSMTGFARLNTPIFPIMDNMHMDTHFFSVPMRLIWDNWEKFNGAREDPDDSIDFLVPSRTTPTTLVEGSLADYFGLPTATAAAISGFSVLPFRAYGLIYDEWFRDQNLQDSVKIVRDDSEQIAAGIGGPNTPPLPRGKRHDYFTSCLTAPQKGESVVLPLGSTAPIASDASYQDNLGVVSTTQSDLVKNLITDNVTETVELGNLTTAHGLYASLADATAATVNELRQAFQIQRLLEKDARGGTRYPEIIKAHFNVTVPDFRVQRPEYLGGGSTPINISPIAQTSSTDATSPQGNLAALGTAGLRNHGFTKSFTEHCIIIGLASVRADLTYQQGMDRMWSRQTRYDFYQPTLSNLGEQAVYSKEIYMDGSASDEDVFGYQERYAEYRYKPSKITGKMRSNATGSLDAWHLSQEFSTRPLLNDAFIQETPPIDRVVAVATEPDFLFDSYFSLRCSRPMPVYAVPGQMDHF